MVNCGKEAVTAANAWDGQRLVVCAEHYAKLISISNAIGVPVHICDLEDGETGCTQKVSDARKDSHAQA